VTPRRRRRRTLRGLALRASAALALGAVLATALPVALFRVVPPPTTAFMLRSHRRDPATGRACAVVDQSWVDWRQIPRFVPIAVLVAEDQRFLQHRGFDLGAIADAVEERVREGRARGASTISQQVAKNLFLWPGKSWVRKGLEAWLTAWLEWLWPKRRILEVYLNVAQFGPCVFGVEAASRRFFDRGAADLTPYQAALLAAVLPNPKRMRAGEPGPFTRERAAQILALMDLPGGPGYLRGL
jgi:monofunctional biosynthetic peptidoglycan transglycosylase